MKNLLYISIIFILINSCKKENQNYTFENIEKTIKVEFNLNSLKTPYYKVIYNNKIVLDSSQLGIIREDANFYSNLKIINISEPKLIKDSYSILQGKQKDITYSANQYTVHLENEGGNLIDIIFQLSNDGIALRYYFPESTSEIKKIVEEKTTYSFDINTKAWLQPMSKAKTGWESTNPSYEEHYSMNVPVSAKSPIGEGWVYPALFNTNDIWVLITETGLQENYCGSRLMYNESVNSLQVTFPQKEEIFPNGALNPQSELPWYTPWRIITIGSLNTITESTLGTDLADKAIDMDTSFIKSGLSSWSWVLLKDEFTNYETSLKFIDYASQMNWPYCLIDADWDTRIGDNKIKELAKYATTKNVKLLLWYNSSGSWNTTPYHPKSKLLTHNDRVAEFTKLNNMGIAGIKVDFFGGDGQSMIAYYHNILKDAAKQKLLVNFHGATLPRGWQRTYPNLMTTEAIKGEEFITFSQETADLQPSHCAMLPFTRNVFDPMDFTPMVLDSIPNIHRRTTPSFELALPVLFLSGIQHIAEIPEGMAKQPEYVINYLKDIPTNWDESKFINGFPGKDVIIARRKGDTWYIVGINGENIDKEFEIDLSFISKNHGYIITDEDQLGFKKDSISLTDKSILTVKFIPYGGFIIKI
ncbi:glycoside hydrolase family 97 protein [Lutibacter sp. B1]|uniref:glycoside hydrolase family 97 protein n=1 Tax=Lutibacter sp. B1 TaxID=2725996 RepID=UPI001456FDD1|nr:glycoside hydrolase family 97 protein [Lutibacter sp. B1]NLP56871.1 glycoside hydrolase family 97 protein [Lutibacter sp. B1]